MLAEDHLWFLILFSFERSDNCLQNAFLDESVAHQEAKIWPFKVDKVFTNFTSYLWRHQWSIIEYGNCVFVTGSYYFPADQTRNLIFRLKLGFYTALGKKQKFYGFSQ